jgi:hypothetical protein
LRENVLYHQVNIHSGCAHTLQNLLLQIRTERSGLLQFQDLLLPGRMFR